MTVTYPRLITDVTFGADYSPEGLAAEEMCFRHGGPLGNRAVAVERSKHDVEFICGDCRENPEILQAAMTGQPAAHQP